MAKQVDIVSGDYWYSSYVDALNTKTALPVVFFLWHGDSNFNKGDVGNVTCMVAQGDDIVDASKVAGFQGFYRSYVVTEVGLVQDENRLIQLLTDFVAMKHSDAMGLVYSKVVESISKMAADLIARKLLLADIKPEPTP